MTYNGEMPQAMYVEIVAEQRKDDEGRRIHALKHMLGHLVIDGGCTPWQRTALIYRCLALATEIGYECGVRQQGIGGSDGGMRAIITLPTGAIAFRLHEGRDANYVVELDRVMARVLEYLGEEETDCDA